MTTTVKRMYLLIEDILVLAKVNSDKYRLEELDLKSVPENVRKEVLRPSCGPNVHWNVTSNQGQ